MNLLKLSLVEPQQKILICKIPYNTLSETKFEPKFWPMYWGKVMISYFEHITGKSKADVKKVFFVPTAKRNFSEARAYCHRNNASLAKTDSIQEQKTLKCIVAKRGSSWIGK